MKKLLFSAFLLALGTSSFAQSASFGLTAGYTNINFSQKGSFDGNSIKVSEGASGFYIGGLVDIAVVDNIHVQPEALFALAEDSKFLYIPVLAKVYVGGSGLHILGGPQANISLEDSSPNVNSLGFDLTFGAGYDINANLFVDARYGFEVTNRYKNGPGDVTAHVNTLNVGVGYKF